MVVTGLPKPPDVRRVFEGADGLLAGMAGGKVWIDHTTTDFGQVTYIVVELPWVTWCFES